MVYITNPETFKGKPADYSCNDSIKIAMRWAVSEWKMEDFKSPVFKGTRSKLLRINVSNVVHVLRASIFNPDAVKGDRDYALLYIGTGDGGSAISKYLRLSHSMHSLLGTIIRQSRSSGSNRHLRLFF